jgi:hypothetical protein
MEGGQAMNKHVKLSALSFLAAALATGGVVGSARAQTTTETTIMTAPVAPSVTTKTVTTRTVVPPPTITRKITTTEESSQVLGEAVRGNTTIIFAAADHRDIRMGKLRTWDEFAEAHPDIARTLAYEPWLINDPVYLQRHPALAAFFAEHPKIKIAMVENPGNFAAIPPRPGE